jgi:hypothetical protein
MPTMLYAVLLRVDGEGLRPVIVRSDEELPCDDGASWRFVAQAHSEAEARLISTRLEAAAAEATGD